MHHYETTGGIAEALSRDADDPLIDISHESLIRQWKKLGEWIDDENNSREIYQFLLTGE